MIIERPRNLTGRKVALYNPPKPEKKQEIKTMSDLGPRKLSKTDETPRRKTTKKSKTSMASKKRKKT